MTSIHNKYKESYNVYIGRPTIFGNPFEIGKDGSRQDVVDKYRAYFHTRIDEDIEFKKQVLSLRGKRLGCFCKPHACHGDIICEYLNNLT